MKPGRAQPQIRGWCPSAHQPMRSGDGLIVRLRPWRAELSASQALALCDLAEDFGTGTLDLTSRANLQLRGVTEARFPALLRALQALELVAQDPALEARRNILLAADWTPGDLTDRLHARLLQALPDLPDLPMKMGHVLDTGGTALAADGSGDFRFELSGDGGLLLRADGATLGRSVSEGGAMPALHELAAWFVATGGRDSGRMARHLRRVALPAAWRRDAPRAPAAAPRPGRREGGPVLGAAFGAIDAAAFRSLLIASGATAVRLMTGRLFQLRGATSPLPPSAEFVTTAEDPRLSVHACPGAPACPQATVATRPVASRLAAQGVRALHVSGCAKGCALPRAAELTLVGRDGRFDLIRGGAPWDSPQAEGLCPAEINHIPGEP